MNKAIAIITARGGSKRIPKKNVKDFLGKPIIQYSIEAALQSNCFDEVMVSTDDKNIADLALQLGAKVPFMRSEKNSDDFATTADVIIEVLAEYKKQEKEFEYACCIYPTAPFVTGTKLKLAFEKIRSANATTVLPIVKFGFPIMRSLKMEDDFVKFNWPEFESKRSQDIPSSYHDAGQFYLVRVNDFLQTKKLFSDKCIGLEMPETEVQDIDTPEDWKMAEIKYNFMLK